MTFTKIKLALGIAAVTLLAAGALTMARSEDTDTDSIGEASAQEKTFATGIHAVHEGRRLQGVRRQW